MAIVVKHAFVSPVADAGNPNEVGPSEWNADHTVIGATGEVTVSDTAPGSPTAGQLWWESDTGVLYIYYNDGDSSQWVQVSGSVANGVTVSDAAPSGPIPGQLWWNSTTCIMSIWYSDADSSQWVQVSTSGTDLTSKVSKAGDTMTGSLVINPGNLDASGTVTANSITAIGPVRAGQNFWATTSNAIFGPETSGIVYLRPQVGGIGEFKIENSGRATCSYGYGCKPGTSAGMGANAFNINWTGSAQLWVDTTNCGTFSFTSDYRIKRNVVDLPEMWETVKALRPISYNLQDYTPPDTPLKEDGSDPDPFIPADDVEHWGFIAHELQDTLIPDAASGEKDQPDLIQSPNPWTVIAALTRALQEAMERIEALEARL